VSGIDNVPEHATVGVITDDHRQNVGSISIRAFCFGCRDHDHHMLLLNARQDLKMTSRFRICRKDGAFPTTCRPVRTVLLHQSQNLVPTGVSSDGKNDITGTILLGVIAAHLIDSECRDALRSPQNRLAQRMPAKMGRHCLFINGESWQIVVHADLFENHLFLGDEVFFFQTGIDDA